jgi:transcription antitermination factor NusG
MIWMIATLTKGGKSNYLNIQEKARGAKEFWIPETKTKTKIHQVLYPKYILINYENLEQAVNTEISWLKAPGMNEPYVLMTHEEASIMDIEDSQPEIKEEREFIAGDLIEVARGPFKGKKGFISAITKNNIQIEGKYRLWISKEDI